MDVDDAFGRLFLFFYYFLLYTVRECTRRGECVDPGKGWKRVIKSTRVLKKTNKKQNERARDYWML